MEFELKDYEKLRLNEDGTRRVWSRKDGLKMASLMVLESSKQLLDFHDLLLSIKDITPKGITFCISHYHVSRVILTELYKALLINERVECGVNIEMKEITQEERSEIKKNMHDLIDKWF